MSESQLCYFRRLLVFAIVLAVIDVCIIGCLLYFGVIELPR